MNLKQLCLLKELLMADEEDDGGEVQEDVQDQEYAGGGGGLEETSDSSAADEELDGDQDDPDNGGRPAVISAGPSSTGDSLLNGSNNLAGIKEPTTFRPPIWQSVGNVSGQAVTFKGIPFWASHPPTLPVLMFFFCPAFCVRPFFFARWLLMSFSCEMPLDRLALFTSLARLSTCVSRSGAKKSRSREKISAIKAPLDGLRMRMVHHWQ